MFFGSIVALVTPFNNGHVDVEKLKEFAKFHLDSQTSGIVPCGTTGEAATLDLPERKKVVSTIVKAVNNRIPVIAGTGTNNTRTTIEYTKMAEELGADAALIVTPYYNKPTQQGLFLHYEAVAKNTKLPIVIYNVPGRTGVSIAPETVARLSKIKNITAIKEASGSMEAITQIRNLCDICILSGEDSMTLPILSLGGSGVISVVANIFPKQAALMVKCFFDGEMKKALDMHSKLFPVCKAMFIETNPIPVKTAMKMMGMINGEVRLPMCEMQAENAAKLRAVLDGFIK